VEGDEIDMEGYGASRASAVLIVSWQRRSSEGATTVRGVIDGRVLKALPYEVIGVLGPCTCVGTEHPGEYMQNHLLPIINACGQPAIPTPDVCIEISKRCERSLRNGPRCRESEVVRDIFGV
jgi:hypothetical protein